MKINKRIGLSILAVLSVPGAVFALDQGTRHELILSGAVETVDRATNSISVLGHTIVVRNAAAFEAGELVNVLGQLDSNSYRLTAINNTGVYSTGVDRVVVRGRVTALNAATGRMQVDGSNIDYTALLANIGFKVPTVGAVVEAIGIQPQGRGFVLASSVTHLLKSSSGEFVIAGVTGVGEARAVGVTGVGTLSTSGVTGVGDARASGVTGVGEARAVGVTGVGTLSTSGVTGVGDAHTSGVTGVGEARAVGVTGVGLAYSAGVTGVGTSKFE